MQNSERRTRYVVGTSKESLAFFLTFHWLLNPLWVKLKVLTVAQWHTRTCLIWPPAPLWNSFPTSPSPGSAPITLASFLFLSLPRDLPCYGPSALPWSVFCVQGASPTCIHLALCLTASVLCSPYLRGAFLMHDVKMAAWLSAATLSPRLLLSLPSLNIFNIFLLVVSLFQVEHKFRESKDSMLFTDGSSVAVIPLVHRCQQIFIE